jgi:hypothetical protein
LQIEGVSHLSRLETLDLSDNQIADVNPLDLPPALHLLILSNNPVCKNQDALAAIGVRFPELAVMCDLVSGSASATREALPDPLDEATQDDAQLCPARIDASLAWDDARSGGIPAYEGLLAERAAFAGGDRDHLAQDQSSKAEKFAHDVWPMDVEEAARRLHMVPIAVLSLHIITTHEQASDAALREFRVHVATRSAARKASARTPPDHSSH